MTKPTPPASLSDLASEKSQIHADNIELTVFSCWTGKVLLRAKLVEMKLDEHGKFITIDIDDDKSAKPQFAESQKDITSKKEDK
jgi:hypothetical protein